MPCMNSSEEYPGLGRRQFLKIVGFGAASLSSAAGLPVMAGPFTSPGPQVKHFVPADKKLSLEWVRGLFRKGAPRVCRGKELDAIGMPVGGIGAGQLYLRGDGTLGSGRSSTSSTSRATAPTTTATARWSRRWTRGSR